MPVFDECKVIIHIGNMIDDQIMPTINEIIDQIEELRRDVHLLKFDFCRLQDDIHYLKSKLDK